MFALSVLRFALRAAVRQEPCHRVAVAHGASPAPSSERERHLRRPEERQHYVDIRIGIVNTGRELTFETSDSAESVRTAVTSALESGATSVTFADAKGATYIVPTAGIAYVEVGSEESRRIGFA